MQDRKDDLQKEAGLSAPPEPQVLHCGALTVHMLFTEGGQPLAELLADHFIRQKACQACLPGNAE